MGKKNGVVAPAATVRLHLRLLRVTFEFDEIGRENGTMAEGTLVVDTDVAGFFKEADRDSIAFCLREFGARLRLEMLLIALLVPSGANA
jgi:hypothetical protein